MARQVFSNDVGNQGDGRLGADRDGRSPSGRAATPSGPSPKRSFWRRALGRLADALARMAEWTAGSSHVADVARLPLTMEWSHSRWRPVPASGIVAAEGGRDPKGLDERSEQSPVGEAETPTPPPVHP
jgi:hypothetical protein